MEFTNLFSAFSFVENFAPVFVSNLKIKVKPLDCKN